MIISENITKYYGAHKALDNISFSITKGEIVGFLGENGAGKTTLMRIMTGYLPASFGKISVCGIDAQKSPRMACRNIGYLPENLPLYPSMTVLDYLKFAAHIKEVPITKMKTRIDRVLEECQLKDVKNRFIDTLSKGFKQRVGIGQAVINKPEVLILDEPTNGLDPVQVQSVRALIKNLEEQRTVILSTHILSEIEQIAQRIVLIKDGRIVTDDSLKNLLSQKSDEEVMILCVKGDLEAISPAISELKGMREVHCVSQGNVHSIDLVISKELEDFNELADKMVRAKARILEIKEKKASLEDVFLKLNNSK